MTVSAARVSELRKRRVRVDGNRVACWRIGSVDLDRCRECVYLLSLEIAGAPPFGQVVCADDPYLDASTAC